MLTERLLATLGRVHRWRLATLVVGIALEVAVVLGIGSDDSLAGVRGIGGESAALLSVVGAVIAGPAVGVGMALVGWIVFFPLIADSSAASVLALPEWVGVALLVGLISRALVALEGRRVQTENDIRAAHALRTPVATIHGLVAVLEQAPTDDVRRPVLLAIKEETTRLLHARIFAEQGRADDSSGG
jgi:signal transduction histidine kinase